MKIFIDDFIKNLEVVNQEREIEGILSAMAELSEHRDSEIRIYLEKVSNYIIAITSNGLDKWKIDCPIKLNNIHKQRYATKQETLNLLEKICNNIDVDNLKGFTDVPVRHFTLDQMLEFKREDDLLLKGKDPDTEKPRPKPAPKPEKAKSVASVIPEKEIADSKAPTKTSSPPKGGAMPLGEGFQI